MIIYKITNIINGKVYIGKTIRSIEFRWKAHIRLASKGTNRKLYDAMNHYGYENFKKEIIENCNDRDQLSEREKYWIFYYKSFLDPSKGYNMTPGGDGGYLSPEIYKKIGEKISIINKGHITTQETRNKISNALTGRFIPEERKIKISNSLKIKGCKPPIMHLTGKNHPMFGKHHSEDSKQKMSLFRKGKTIEEIYSKSTVLRLRELSKQRLLGENNPQYKNIDKEQLYKLLQDGFDNEYISKIFNCSDVTIIAKTKLYFNKTPSQLRKEFFGTTAPRTKLKDYKEVDFLALLYYIKKGKTRREISQLLDISETSISNKLKKRYNLDFKTVSKKIEEVINGEKISNNQKNKNN